MGRCVTLSSGAWVETPFAVRVAGLPARLLTSLRFDKSFVMAEEIVDLRERLESDGPVLADALYEVIGGLSGSAVKPALVGLRRALHRARRPRPAEWNDRVAEAVPRWLADRIRAWVGELDELESATASLPDVLTAEMAAKQSELRATARHAGFRRALSQASSTLFDELSKWLADEARVPRRQSLIRLAKYVARAAAKTSPYSTFLVSGLGGWTDEGPTVRSVEPRPVRGVMELDGSFLRKLIRALCEDPALSPSLRLRVNPSATVTDGRISFVGRPPDEPIITTSATPAIRECLRILQAAPELTVRALRDALAAVADAPAGRVESFVNGLVDAGLLERQSPIADLSGDPLGDLTEWLTACGDGAAAGIATLVGRVRAEIRRDVPVDDVDGHDSRRRAVVQAVRELAARVDGLAEVGDRLGKWTYHENAVFAEPAVECSVARWRPALADLDIVRRWLVPFDPGLPLRLALGAYFRERFGAGAAVPVLALHRAVQEELRRGGAPEQPPAAAAVARLYRTDFDGALSLQDSALPRLRELARIRRQARDAVLSAEPVDGVIRAAPAALAALAAAWPHWVPSPEPLGCYVQPAGDDEKPSLVLNVAHGGHGRGRSRLSHLIRQATGATPADQAWRSPAAGPVLAELGGQFSTSLNVRTAGVPYELEYPFTTSDRPREQRIRTGDCVAVHDADTDLVQLRAAGMPSEVVPLHLGMMADTLLPPVARLLTRAFGRGGGYYARPSLFLSVADEDSDPPNSVVAYPRVAAGQVVLRRACWLVPLELVPNRAGGDTDAGYWLRLLRWQRAHDIPTRCFVRVWPGGPRPADGTGAHRRNWLLSKSRKPLYVDFANWYLVTVLQRMLSGSGSMVMFEEALPAPDDARHPTGEPAVTEFLIEISDPEAS